MDAFVVLEDANIKDTAKTAAMHRLANCGQICISPKRFIIPEDKADDFITNLKSEIANVKVGDPLSPDTFLGPMSSENIVNDVSAFVNQSKTYGDELIAGGNQNGLFYDPTVIKIKDVNSPVWKNEVFGPVFAITTYKTEDEALELANDSEYGLGGSVFGTDKNHAHEFASKIDSGMVYVNSCTKGLHELPFGGIKNSGYGREGGEAGVHSFANIQTYFVKD